MSNPNLLQDIEAHGVHGAVRQNFAEELQGAEVSWYLTGSSVFKSDRARFIDGTSDVDTLLICADTTDLGAIADCLGAKRPPEDGKYDVVNMSVPYGEGRNKLHIKAIDESTFDKIVEFEPLHLRSFRPTPLTLHKSVTRFSTSSPEYPVHRHRYLERPAGDAFELTYILDPVLPDGELILSDWHSMVLLAEPIVDGLEVEATRRAYSRALLHKIGSLSLEQQDVIVGYFSDRHDVSADDLCLGVIRRLADSRPQLP